MNNRQKKKQEKIKNEVKNIKIKIDYEKNVESIVTAHKKIEELKNKEIQNKENNILKQRQKRFGYDPKKSNLKNNISLILNIIKMKKDDAKEPIMIMIITKLLIWFAAQFAKLFLYYITITHIFNIYETVDFIIINPININLLLSIIKILSELMFSIIYFLWARLMRVVCFEIENINEDNLINNIFTGVFTLLSLMVSVNKI